MGDKNPKKQKKKKRVVEKNSMTPLPAEEALEQNQQKKPKKQNRGR